MESTLKRTWAEIDLDALAHNYRALRAQIARRQGVPAYVVFSDKTLREMAVVQPRTSAELRAVSGVGDAKASRYGEAFLREIGNFSDRQRGFYSQHI